MQPDMTILSFEHSQSPLLAPLYRWTFLTTPYPIIFFLQVNFNNINSGLIGEKKKLCDVFPSHSENKHLEIESHIKVLDEGIIL